MDIATTLFTRGFHDVLSVVPPGATLSPRSKLNPESIGKVPGRRNTEGSWGGYNWRHDSPSLRDVQQWDRDGANVGLRTARFPAIDIDTTDPAIAVVVRDLAHALLGPAPSRIGRPPKTLLLYRTESPFKRMRLWFSQGDTRHLVEVLGDGQQFVAGGIHPATRQPYAWDRPLDDLSPNTLTLIDREKVQAFLAQLQVELEARGFTCQREGRGGTAEEAAPDQVGLRAPSLDALAEAVALIPNSNEEFPGRDDYLRMGYAIRAAAQADVERGFAVFLDWALTWEGNDWVTGNEPDGVRADWDRMRAPYRVGWPWIAELARARGFNDAVFDFAADPSATPPPAPAPVPPEFSEQHLAEEVLTEHGERIRSVPLWKSWLRWDGIRWIKDDIRHVPMLAARTLRRIAAELLRRFPRRVGLARGISSATKVRNVLALVCADARAVLTPDLLDADPWLLNTPAGIVDLRTGVVGPHRPTALMTKSTTVGPDRTTPCTRWLQFLQEVTAGNASLVQYLQRLAGYCLTGSVREHAIVFIYGPGGNGKSVFLNVLLHILGDYGAQAPMSTFLASTFERHPTEVAALRGARLVAASETSDDGRWNTPRLKSLSGGDPITARFMFGDFFTFQMQGKLVLVGNHKPSLAHVDEAIRRRLHLVPFIVQPPRPDPELLDKLRAEAPAILAWMVDGCLAWLAEGLAAPETVRDATQEYFSDEDLVGRWLVEECDQESTAHALTKDLFDSWSRWCQDRREDPGTEKRLAQTLANRGFGRWRDPKTRRKGFTGIAVRPTGEDAQDTFAALEAGI